LLQLSSNTRASFNEVPVVNFGICNKCYYIKWTTKYFNGKNCFSGLEVIEFRVIDRTWGCAPEIETGGEGMFLKGRATLQIGV
jgi:hypothetical protein